MEEVDRHIEATCPECRGPLTQVRRGDFIEYRCLVGHSYTAGTMLASHHETEERSLWAAAVALEEAANLVKAAAPEFEPEIAARLTEQAEKKAAQAVRIREILEDLDPLQFD